MEINWQEHYKDRSGRAISAYLIKAISFVKNKGTAVDLGTGDLVDAKYLLEEGFNKVIAIDKEIPPQELLVERSESGFEFIKSEFDKFEFPINEYDLVNAHYSLPFNSPETFTQVWNGIEQSLVTEGVFAGQFYGVNDEWNNQKRSFTFHTKEEVEKLLSNMDILEFQEEEIDRKLAGGHTKHWHIFHVIARAK